MGALNIDTQLLRSFVTISDAGGFARAADQLHMTQPAISQQMRRLEDILGQTLFRREGRVMRMTPEGELLLTYARQLIDINDEIARRLRGRRNREVVKLGMPEHFSETILPRIIAVVAETCPDVQLVVKIGTSQVLSEGLVQGDVDLALVLTEMGGSPGSALQMIPVNWVAGESFDLRDGEALPLVLFNGQCTFRTAIIKTLEVARVPWQCVYETGDLISLRAAVRANLGITGLPYLHPRVDLKIVDDSMLLPALPMSEVTLRFRPAWASKAAEQIGEIVVGAWREFATDGRAEARDPAGAPV